MPGKTGTFLCQAHIEMRIITEKNSYALRLTLAVDG